MAISVIAVGCIAVSAQVFSAGASDPSSSYDTQASATQAPESRNPDTIQELNSQPFANAQPAGATLLTRDEAERLARDGARLTESAPAFSALMSGSQAESVVGFQRNSNVNEDRDVWVVSVQGDVHTEGGPAEGSIRQVKAYSILIDAASGIVTDDCFGCSWLTASE